VHYRLYQLSPTTGGIINGSDVEAASDKEAVASAHALLGAKGAPFELWRGATRILAHQVGQPRRTE
jgi:hypothetical protein